MINGIPIQTTSDKGERVVTYFASLRKCPALREKILAEHRATIAHAVAARRVADALQAIAACDTADLATAEATANTVSEVFEAASQALADARNDFITTGLLGAGYAADDVEALAAGIPPERVPELLEKCRLGAGRCDFS